MTHPITFVLILNAHLLLPPLPTIRRAHQLLPITVSVFRFPDLAAAVQALVTPLRPHTLAGCDASASVVFVMVAAFLFPKCLVATQFRICGLPGCSCACELNAGVDIRVVSAPAIQREAVALAYFVIYVTVIFSIYIAGSRAEETLQ